MMTVPTSANKFEGLQKAVESNNVPMIKQWIKLGAPLPDDTTLMSPALRSSRDITVAALLDAGAVKSSNAQEVLYVAVSSDRVDFAKRIFNEHVDSMLLTSVCVKLIEAADPNVQGSPQMRMLEYALTNVEVIGKSLPGKQMMLEKAVERGNLEAATKLIEAGAGLSEWLAFNVKAPGMIGPLVRMGMDLHCEDENGNTPILHYAATGGEATASLISEAIGAGADPMAKTRNGETLLDRFLTTRYREIATRGAVTFSGPEEDRALAARLFDMGIACLAQQGASDTARPGLRQAIVFGAKKTIEEEIARLGSGVIISGDRYFSGALTPMQVAAFANSADGVVALHSLGMDVNEGGPNLRDSPLTIAVVNNKPRAVAALVSCGANHKVKVAFTEGGSKQSLLAHASQSKFDEVARLLRGVETSREIERALDEAIGVDDQPESRKSNGLAPL